MDQTQLQRDIVKELGLEELNEDTQKKILTKMTASVLKRITINILEKLSEQELDEFEKLQQAGNAEAIDNFLRSKVENYEQLVQDTIVQFKKEMKDTIQTLKNS